MHVLGINAYHGGASACLIRDGHLVAAAEEERFCRVKYWAGFPTRAIQYCLEEGGVRPQDVDHVAISRDPRANVHRKVLFTLRRRPNLSFVRDRLKNLVQVRDLPTAFAEAVDVPVDALGARFHNVEHHRAHMASAFFVSPFEEAAILSVDGMGDFVSTMWGSGRGSTLSPSGAVYFPHSLGYLYTMVSQWLGFTKYGDEGKVMGLAPYGEPAYEREMRDVLQMHDDGSFELNLEHFLHHSEGVDMTWADGAPVIGCMFSRRFVEVFGPPRDPQEELTGHHQDVAASLQSVLEQAELALLRRIHAETGQTNLCMAGGVALNSAFNGRILPETPFEEIFIQPAAGDAGTSLGAAYFVYHQVLGHPRTQVMTDAYTGPSFTNGRIGGVLDGHGLRYRELDEDTLVTETAKLLAGGAVVGWFQGRMEWGPRALGGRSILADPRRSDMKDILNARIKHREPFRPFAPSVLLEETGSYFDQSYPDPFMLKVYGVRPEKRDVIPAVTHVDGTGRLQTVDRETAPLYWKLIDAFRRETGVPVVLNTSFNENEPIVCVPEEAVECFRRTRMDALAIGSYLVRKGDPAGGDGNEGR